MQGAKASPDYSGLGITITVQESFGQPVMFVVELVSAQVVGAIKTLASQGKVLATRDGLAVFG